MRSKTWLLPVALPAALLALAAAGVVWTAQRTLSRSSASAPIARQIKFSVRSLDLAGPTHSADFEPVASPQDFSSGAFFAGDLFLGGPGGLDIDTPDGILRWRLRPGLELPTASIVAMASGRLRGASGPQLLLATAGAGLLLLDPTENGAPALHQLLPEPAAAPDLTALLPLSSGDLLLGTRHDGVLLFNGTTLTPLDLGSARGFDASRLDITALKAVDSASFLIGTCNAGVFFLHAGTTQQVDEGGGLPDDQVEALAVADGHVYVGTPLGTAQLDLDPAGEEALKVVRILAPGTFSHALALDPTNSELLIGTLDEGMREVSLSERLHGHLRVRRAGLMGADAQLAEGRVDQFIAADAATVYALVEGKPMRRDAAAWTPILEATAAANLADRNISALAFAPDGELYVGFFDRGLDILPPDATGTIRHFEDDHLFCVNRLVLDPRLHTMAAATANGLVSFDRGGTPRQVLTRRDGLISDHVSDVAYTRSGMTLATPAGLTSIGASGVESVYAFQGLVNNHVYALSGTTDDDRLIAGTLGGLSLLEDGAIKRNLTAADSGLKHNWITAVVASPAGGWLIGTYGAGVVAMSADGNRFMPIELPSGVPRDLVINPNAMLVTHTHIYAGTLGQGMLVFDRAAERWSVVSAGLPSLNVTAFAERDGKLYVGTENGLVRIAEALL